MMIVRHKKFRAAYSMIRVVCWKFWKAGISNERELFILFDEDTEAFPNPDPELIRTITGQSVLEFDNSYDAIKKIAAKDPRFRRKISFCNQGHSHVLGIIQLTDILTGAMSCVANKLEGISEEHKTLVEYIRERIGHDFEASRAELTLPKLNAYKIHFLDPIALSERT